MMSDPEQFYRDVCRDGLELAERSWRELRRGVVMTRWVYLLALAFQFVALAVSLLAGSWWAVVYPVLIAVLWIGRRRFIARSVDLDRFWQEAVDYWRSQVR